MVSMERATAEDKGLTFMTFQELIEILDAELLAGNQHLEKEVKHAFAAHSLSDVLSFSPEGALLVTGITNIQVVRIAELLDLSGIVFVGGKRPDAMTLKLADKKNVLLLSTPLVMFEACGILFKNGLEGSIKTDTISATLMPSPLADPVTSVKGL